MEEKIISGIIEKVNKNSKYEMKYIPSRKELVIRSEKGIHVEDFMKIKKAIKPFVKNIVVE